MIIPTKIYLAGACKNVPDEGRAWRTKATMMLNRAAEMRGTRVAAINPLDYFTYAENKQISHKQVKNYYLNRIRNCDVVLVNLDGTNSSPGTAQETQFAVDMKIPVIGFGTSEIYHWISDVDCDVTFKDMSEAIDYIRDYFME